MRQWVDSPTRFDSATNAVRVNQTEHFCPFLCPSKVCIARTETASGISFALSRTRFTPCSSSDSYCSCSPSSRWSTLTYSRGPTRSWSLSILHSSRPLSLLPAMFCTGVESNLLSNLQVPVTLDAHTMPPSARSIRKY